MITIEDYLMGRHLQYPAEYNNKFQCNAESLIRKVNNFLDALNVNPRVTSGFRPPSINRKVIGAAKRSHHQTCNAIDLEDSSGALGIKASDPALLEQFGLYLEDPTYTKGWIHLQDLPPRSKRRIFIP